MTPTLKLALLLALGATLAAPALGSDRRPRAGGPAFVVVEAAARAPRTPRAGAPVAPAPAAALSGEVAGASRPCGYKYCGAQ